MGPKGANFDFLANRNGSMTLMGYTSVSTCVTVITYLLLTYLYPTGLYYPSYAFYIVFGVFGFVEIGASALYMLYML